METPTEFLDFQGSYVAKSVHEASGTEAFQMRVPEHLTRQGVTEGYFKCVATSLGLPRVVGSSSVLPGNPAGISDMVPAALPTQHSSCAFVFSDLLTGFLTQSCQSSPVQLSSCI